MRSYVLDPYQMVKDLRTEYEVGNPSQVFDGDLDGFIAAGIKWRKQPQRRLSATTALGTSFPRRDQSLPDAGVR